MFFCFFNRKWRLRKCFFVQLRTPKERQYVIYKRILPGWASLCVRKRAEGLTGFVSSLINHTVPLPSHTLLSVSLLHCSRSLGYITTWRLFKSAETLLTSAKSRSLHIQKDAGLFSLPETNTLGFSLCCCCSKPAMLFRPSEMCTSDRMS